MSPPARDRRPFSEALAADLPTWAVLRATRVERRHGPYRAVLNTYLHRPLFLALAAAVVGWPVVQVCLELDDPLRRPAVLGDLSGACYALALPIVCAVAWTAHVRDALVTATARLTPRYFAPHVAVAAAAFAALVVAPVVGRLVGSAASDALHSPAWFEGGLPPDVWTVLLGGLVVTVSLATAAALSATFGRAWVSVVLAPLALTASSATGLDPWWALGVLYHRAFYDGAGYRAAGLATANLIGLDLLLAVALVWRLRRGMGAGPSVDRGATAAVSPAEVGRRAPLTTAWSRVRHRRSAAVGGAAPWLAGGLVMAVLLFVSRLMRVWNDVDLQVKASLILVTILPAVAVVCLWAERWPRLAAESLLPASRRRFAAETALALAVDLASFWVAVAVGVTVPLVVAPTASVDRASLAAHLGASAGVQVLGFAALLWSLSLRSWPATAVLLGAALAAMAGPIAFSGTRASDRPAGLPSGATAALAGVGLLLAAAAYRRWRYGNLA